MNGHGTLQPIFQHSTAVTGENYTKNPACRVNLQLISKQNTSECWARCETTMPTCSAVCRCATEAYKSCPKVLQHHFFFLLGIYYTILGTYSEDNQMDAVDTSFFSTWGIQVLRYPNFFLRNGSRQKRESCWRRCGCSLGWARPSGNTVLPVECL